MTSFNKSEFFLLKTQPEKITYLDSCIDTEIILDNLTYTEYSSIITSHSKLYLALARKKCSFGLIGREVTSILNLICHNCHCNADIVIEALKSYETNKGFTTKSERSVIYKIFCYSDIVYPRDKKLVDYTLEMYDRLEIPINIRVDLLSGGNDTLECIAKSGRIDYFMTMLRAYKARDIPLDKNIFIKFIPRMSILKNYRVYKSDLTPIVTDEVLLLREMIVFCIENGLNIHNEDRLFWDWINQIWKSVPVDEQSENIIKVLPKIIKESYDWDTLKLVFDYYQNHGISLIENGYNPLYSMAVMHDVSTIDYMLNYCDSHGILYDLNDGDFIKNVIESNSVAVLKYLISRGAKPKNAIYNEYVPCPSCYNGEQHSCNFRNITLEYILLARYEIRLADLYNPTVMDKLEDTNGFGMSWYDCNGDADDDEVYTEPGIDFMEWYNFLDDGYNTETQRKYRVAPVIITKEEFAQLNDAIVNSD
jgi:hypothetical protein